ncbi:MAG: AraC family transcriptional regulator [Anaerolineales bacterium]|nr:AraC family transcriptional regulator [Anaerolineales bacterium]
MENSVRLLPILVHIQTHLAENLSLDIVAQLADLSPFHFHRLFQESIGETLKQYTERLRLERAAYLLRLRDETILDVALNCGFQSHETFTRAFKRHFNTTPRRFRQGNGRLLTSKTDSGVNGHLLNHMTQTYQLSKVTIQKRAAIQVAFLRHVGDYVNVSTGLYDRLTTWAKAYGAFTGQNLLLGIGHDSPGITPTGKLRFDACIELFKPIQPTTPIGYQIIPGGTFGIADYTGPLGPTMYQAYVDIFTQLTNMKNIEIIGLPVIEIYHTTQINPDYALNHVEICIPVKKKVG